ncbi:MAG TPA: 4-(cytidine 5'-diphospho)-2-C-methyl-D-erythritol kinase [Cyclobacteriaceae bacterium]
MVSFPPCKINLGLQIINKRTDGFHNLATCFYPVPCTDILEIIPSQEVSLSITGIDIPGDINTNLCLKAYYLLQQDYNIPPVKIHLHKIIPTGAGLGGGSSDAAHTLRLLNTIFELQLSTQKLFDYAAQLGSDCAFFIQDKPMIGTGRGEVLTESSVNLRGKFLVLVKPDVHVSTAEAYGGVTPAQPAIELTEILSTSVSKWKNTLVNDFESSVFNKHHIIKQLKEELYTMGASYACMSGSGSSVFGIFEKEIVYKPDYLFSWSGFL